MVKQLARQTATTDFQKQSALKNESP
jgi:hypothetical protein